MTEPQEHITEAMESSGPSPHTENDPPAPSDPPREDWPRVRAEEEEEQEEEEEAQGSVEEEEEQMKRGGRADGEEEEEEEEEAQGSVEEEEEQMVCGGRADGEEAEGRGGGGGGGGGGYACRICGFQARDVRQLSQHLHTLHPVPGPSPLSARPQQIVALEGGPLSMATEGGEMQIEREEAGPEERGAGLENISPVLVAPPPDSPPRLPALPPPGPVDSEGGGHNRAALVCLPLVAAGLKLVWTRADRTRELDGVPELVRAFNAFPYPSPAETAALARRCALPLDSVRVWFMAQRVRYGISWAAEEIEETRGRLGALHRRPEEEEEQGGPDEEVGVFSPKFWGSGDQQRGGRGAGHGGGVMGSAMRDFLFRRTRPFRAAWRGGRRPLDPAPSPLFVVAPPAGRGRKSKLQLRALRRSFVRDNWLSEAELRRLQAETGLSRGEVRKWFSDSRYQLRHNGLRPPAPPAEDSLLQEGGVGEEPAVSMETEVPPDPPVESPEEGGGGAVELEAALIGGEPDPASPGPASPGPVLLTSRGRLRKTKQQLAVLKHFFLRCQWPTSEDYTRLVQRTALPRPDVIQWFGDARYRVKNGNLRWVRSKREHAQIVAEITHGDRRRGAENGGGAGEASVRGAEVAEKATPPASGADVRPLERFWRRTGAGPGEADLSALSRQAGMSAQQVRDWFSCQLSGMAEVEVNISD